jgi:hypothetical protein
METTVSKVAAGLARWRLDPDGRVWASNAIQKISQTTRSLKSDIYL